VKVLAYTDSEIFSGAEMVLCDLVRGLSQRSSIDLEIAAPASNIALTQALCRAGDGMSPIDVKAQPLPLAAVHLFDPRRRHRLGQALKGLEPDVLLVNLPSAEYGGLPLRRRMTGAKTLGLLHVPGSPRALGFRLGAIRERLARHVLANLDSVGVLSESAIEIYRHHWDNGATAIHHLRLPRPKVEVWDRVEARRSLGLSNAPLIGIAGRLSFKQKGHDTFVEAAEILVRGQPELRFAVAGEGRDRSRLERLLEDRGLRQQFDLLGHVTPIERFFAAVDVIAIPSRFEGLPVIALEALEVGTPGVAASTDGLRDVWPLEWQVPADDARQLAAALKRMLDATTSERSEMIAEGRRRMEAATGADLAAQVEPLILSLAHV